MEDRIELDSFDESKLRETKRILRQFDSFYAPPTKPEMPAVVVKTIEKALKDLRMLGCAYRVLAPNRDVIEHDVDKFKPPKPERKYTKKFAQGELKAYCMPYIQNLDVGGVAVIPADTDKSIKELQHAVTSHMSAMWGNGSYTTYMNRADNTLEVLRKA